MWRNESWIRVSTFFQVCLFVTCQRYLFFRIRFSHKLQSWSVTLCSLDVLSAELFRRRSSFLRGISSVFVCLCECRILQYGQMSMSSKSELGVQQTIRVKAEAKGDEGLLNLLTNGTVFYVGGYPDTFKVSIRKLFVRGGAFFHWSSLSFGFSALSDVVEVLLQMAGRFNWLSKR